MTSRREESHIIPAWAPWLFTGISFAAGYLSLNTEAATVKHLSAAAFGVFLGLALGCWGIEEHGQGRIRGARSYVSRSESPALFMALLAVKRVIPGVVMIAAGIWYLLGGMA